ncbi:hypothetical protein [Sulfitobacter donghicola]|uniref:Uncharacterized protein n=1 Tax=Sulfitobacter donghicola DSW-25 = KCTC 12864 = JCM 14565 TaxID=1300350 RepID=A0A073IJA7_9RHOB|nr:hypothetical protein [Sulfitobacter donghicola]KEJ89665.1 hypothetical protein DSW25_11270 [Sulfitobacter donghicola DSW-25 = KCTC 12864 = JCM 14565]KIN69399.1 Signal peptide-containing protein [Sulfitobacter donghicola DSW-25 = KCTC 12864 = JCM 14565]
MIKILLLPVLIVFSCLLAGLYGVVNNQISYSVSSGYFHEFKFIQFGIEPAFHNRVGASIVGFLASWWMGVLIGLPIYFAALFVRGARKFLSVFLKAALIVVAVTLLTGITALVVSYLSLDADTLPPWMQNRGVADPLAFARAGTMHNFSYLGGGIGLLIGFAYTIWQAWRLRKNKPIS